MVARFWISYCWYYIEIMNTVYFEKNSRWVFLSYYWIRQKVNHLDADTPFRVILEAVLWRRKHWLTVVHVLLQDVRSCLFNAYNFFIFLAVKYTDFSHTEWMNFELTLTTSNYELFFFFEFTISNIENKWILKFIK